MLLVTKIQPTRNFHKRGKTTSRVLVLRCDNIVCQNVFERKFGKHLLTRQHFCCKSCINKNRSHTDDTKQLLSELNSGELNGFFGKKHTQQSLDIISDKSKLHYSSLSEDEKQAKRDHLSVVLSGHLNPFFNKKHTEVSRQSMSIIRSEKIASGEIQSGPRGKKGLYQSKFSNERFDSFFELFFMKQLDADSTVIHWTKKHGIIISYEFEGKSRKYVPDFLIIRENMTSIEEVKGYEDQSKLCAKILAASSFADDKHMNFVLWDHIKLESLAKIKFGMSLRKLRKLWLE